MLLPIATPAAAEVLTVGFRRRARPHRLRRRGGDGDHKIIVPEPNLSFRTQLDRMQLAMDDVQQAAAEVLA